MSEFASLYKGIKNNTPGYDDTFLENLQTCFNKRDQGHDSGILNNDISYTVVENC